MKDSALVGNKVEKFNFILNPTVVNSGERFYLRVYPHNKASEGWAKLIAVDSVAISGVTVGVKADAPTVSTIAASYVSNNISFQWR